MPEEGRKESALAGGASASGGQSCWSTKYRPATPSPLPQSKIGPNGESMRARYTVKPLMQLYARCAALEQQAAHSHHKRSHRPKPFPAKPQVHAHLNTSFPLSL